ncbi:MAG: chemotaxis protein [Helicobacteraceae bacterium]|nr:chemotaxis protein [Helicobacteraceae bacterium]
MTQEELNGLILGNFDNMIIDEDETNNNQKQESKQNTNNVNPFSDDGINNIKVDDKNFDVNHYKVDSDNNWPPPPPISDHKVVDQLDDVTKGLEVKATQVFDELEIISTNTEIVTKEMQKIKQYLESQKDLFQKLSVQFPNITVFQSSLQSSNDMLKQANIIIEKSNESTDSILQAMDIMQYQDIHRQKIERVVNIMRTLAKYLNSMFDTDIDDSKRVSSATYIEGDTKEDLASSEDIEQLINDLGKK